ncbi:MAG: hypothetical protein JXR91_12505 [Deltaproteobacteria bacterium]|nr:hypothetical protein [Deltaproteobacteria bacterium]
MRNAIQYYFCIFFMMILNSSTAFSQDIAPSAKVTAGYKKGFYIHSEDSLFKLNINGMIKTRFDLFSDESIVQNAAGDSSADRTLHSSFDVPFARIQLSGNLFSKKLKYNFYYNLPDNKMIYAWIGWDFIPEKFVIKAGMFKRPFGRAFLTSSVKKEFIDAPLGQMGTGRDIGVELSNQFDKVKGLEWAVGVFNGENGTGGYFSPVLAGRIGFNNGIAGYSETDFEGGPFRYGIGLSASTEFDHDNNNTTTHNISADATLKIHGFNTSAGFYLQSNAQEYIGDKMNLANIGGHIQAGYLINNLIEPVARYGFLHSPHVRGDLKQQMTAGLTIHIFPGHHFKWENNVTLQKTPLQNDIPAADLWDMLFTSQLQCYF